MPDRRDLANAIRALSMDAVQKANSGHPGMPMGMADIAEVLWNDFLVHNPGNPGWPNRDRFVLSNGHGSMLLYSLLHLTGYPLTIADLASFRQLGAKTPGHPELDREIGVETTTGPLGQGLATAVGMATGERILAARFNRPGHDIIDHYTYVFAGDGCLMEGISHEACSLAGTLGLGKLIVFYDDNGISIDGEVSGWFTDDTPARFQAYRWHVVPDVDGHDPEALVRAVEEARAATDRPSLICCRTVIGWGSPGKQGTAATHGAALGDDEVAATRKHIGWPHPPFEVPGDIRDAWDATEKGAAAEAGWVERLEAYRAAFPESAAELERRLEGALPEDWDAAADAFVAAGGRQRQEDGYPKGLGGGAGRIRPPAARTGGRLGRPHRVQQHLVEGLESDFSRGFRRQLPVFRCSRVRHDRDAQRPGPARGLQALRRNVSRVLRLRAQCGPARGADEDPVDPRLHP